MNRWTVIVSGGMLEEEFARSVLENPEIEFIIGVDRGLEFLYRHEICPNYIVGDFDTVSGEVVERFRNLPFIVWEQHKPEKNETDTELARSRALTLGCEKLVFLGATGGRLDHMLGNLHALYACLEKGIDASLVDTQNRIYLLDQGKTFYRKTLWGKYVSFLPYTEEVTGITLTGFRYPLQDKTIQRGQEVGLCISNELAEDRAVLEFREGILICVESSD